MTRSFIPLMAVLAAAAPVLLRAEETRRVTAVRCWSFPEATRVAIEVNGDFKYHADRAHNPERIFFDIPHARPSIEGKVYYTKKVGDGLLKKIRVAEPEIGLSRIVLDLQHTAEYTATQLSNPDRLVIELRAPGTPAPPVTPSEPPVISKALPVPAAPPEPSPEPAAPPVESHKSNIEPTVAAKPAGGGAESLTRALGLKVRRIVLDPGHGGHDQGTSGPAGLLEKDLVLDVALRLGKLLEARMGSEVIFTRSDDTFIPLERRTAIANEKKADLFLSIHANSSSYPRIGGVESYYLNFTTSKDALALASRENASSDKSVFELRDLIQKITMQDKAEESREFAGRIQASLFPFAARYNPGIKNRGVKKAPFVVLIGASMPSVLAEIGFISNPREEGLLSKPEHRQRLAEALYQGVFKYAQSLSHVEVAQASGQGTN